MKLAEIYYAYDLIYKSIHCPFASVHVTTLFNASYYLTTQLLGLSIEPPEVQSSTMMIVYES